ncbi:uncharacterized protein PHACADRAFT_253417 [Phanerochaete carnosa HHB-10118-sp]|uniref:Uncharacterized protein n=1 Tax=Phanerochaete carnosa (strain HHB-10118-sp) TaxID=650164 RepID=K5WAY4_PHACS|nr:uncharacterized protein PHACADRAFT_253417 [Phanerochaete carnosa HHB-10118-sp]EKM56350.1 hypothetical protein PHACADRAFT_253417 [Phanerochaete carnosa HHB-10118-sp]
MARTGTMYKGSPELALRPIGHRLNAVQPAQPLLMDEFDPASCGEISGSNRLAVSLWMVDYVLQMASVGYLGVYLRTHKLGVLYNLLKLLVGVAGSASVASANMNTNFYAVLTVVGAPVSANGSRILNLDIDSLQSNYSAVHVAAPFMTRQWRMCVRSYFSTT